MQKQGGSLNARTVTLIGEAVFARCLSSIKAERVRASKAISGPQKEEFKGDKKQFIDDLEQALYASKIISYTQGFMLMRETAKEVSNNFSHPVHIAPKLIDSGFITAQVELELRRHCAHVAWWLHYQVGLPRRHHLCVPEDSRPRVAPLRRLLQQGCAQGSARLAAHHRSGRSLGYPHPRVQHGLGVLRWLQERGCPC